MTSVQSWTDNMKTQWILRGTGNSMGSAVYLCQYNFRNMPSGTIEKYDATYDKIYIGVGVCRYQLSSWWKAKFFLPASNRSAADHEILIASRFLPREAITRRISEGNRKYFFANRTDAYDIVNKFSTLLKNESEYIYLWPKSFSPLTLKYVKCLKSSIRYIQVCTL